MSHDTWIHRLARIGVRPLAAARVKPNHITTLRLATGLAAAIAFAVGSMSANALGAALFLLSMVLDRTDGELARLTGQTSAWGHRYDLVADHIANAAAFIGIGVGARGMLGPVAIVLGTCAGLGVLAILALVMRVEVRHGERAAEFRSAGGFDIDDALLLVPLAVVSGFGWMCIMAAGIAAPLFSLAMWWHHHSLARPHGGPS
jgi:phosphatidylglycerophosphate synthase